MPTIPEWIASNLAVGDRIGADPKLVGADVWLDWSNDLGPSISSSRYYSLNVALIILKRFIFNAFHPKLPARINLHSSAAFLIISYC